MIKAILLDVGGTLIKNDFNQTLTLQNGVKENIPLLSQKYELYLATRYDFILQEKFLKYFKLEQFIKFIKENPPAHKPNPKFFIWLLQKINKNANETLMIGDDLEIDIIPAKSLGMKTILITQQNLNTNAPDFIVSNFAQAAKILLKNKI